MRQAPACLHIPPLQEGSDATLVWPDVPDTQDYHLECVYDQSFSQADSGLTWGDIHDRVEDWMDSQDSRSWDEWNRRAAHGYTWFNIVFKGSDWISIQKKQFDWRGFHALPPDFMLYTGRPSRAPYEPEQATTWENYHARCMDWSHIHANAFSWRTDCDQLPCNALHLTSEVQVPPHKKSVTYRLRCDEGEVIETAPLPIAERYRREDSLQLRAVKEEEYLLPVSAEEIARFGEVKLTLDYPGYVIDIHNSAQQDRYGMHVNRCEHRHPSVYHAEEGRIEFRCGDEITNGKRYSGLALAFWVKVIRSGTASITLR